MIYVTDAFNELSGADRKVAADIQTYRLAMAAAVDAEIKAAAPVKATPVKADQTPLRRRPRLGVVQDPAIAKVKAEQAAWKAEAAIVEEMKAVGYAQLVAEGTLNVGRAVRHAKLAEGKGPEAGRNVNAPEIRVKSDGKRDSRLVDARRRITGREAELFDRKAAEMTGQPIAKADRLDGRQNALIASFGDTAADDRQAAYDKPDAADTGRWFEVAE